MWEKEHNSEQEERDTRGRILFYQSGVIQRDLPGDLLLNCPRHDHLFALEKSHRSARKDFPLRLWKWVGKHKLRMSDGRCWK